MTHRRLKDFLIIAVTLVLWAAIIVLSATAQAFEAHSYSRTGLYALYAVADGEITFRLASEGAEPRFYAAGSAAVTRQEEGTWKAAYVTMQARGFIGVAELDPIPRRSVGDVYIDGNRYPWSRSHEADTAGVMGDFRRLASEYESALAGAEAESEAAADSARAIIQRIHEATDEDD